MLKALTMAVAAGAMTWAGMAMAGPDDAAMRGYVLTMAKLQKYRQVSVALHAAHDPATRAEVESLDGLLNDGTSGGLAKLRRAPHVEAAIRQNGLSDADFVLIPAVMVGASMAAAYPKSAASMPVSAANIAFVKQHGAEIKALKLGGE